MPWIYRLEQDQLAYSQDGISRELLFGNSPSSPVISRMPWNNQQWQSVAIKTNNGFISLEMQDSGWIYFQSPSGPPGKIQEVKVFGPGKRPEIILNEIYRLLGSDSQELNNYQNRVTLYVNQHPTYAPCVLASDGLYYNLQTGDPSQTANGLSVQISIPKSSEDVFHYLVGERLETGLARQESAAADSARLYSRAHLTIVRIDRLGDLKEIIPIGTYNPGDTYRFSVTFRIPDSLQIKDGHFPIRGITALEDQIGGNRINELIQNHQTLDRYPLDKDDLHIYFVWNSSIPYKRIETFFENMQNNQILGSLPDGPLRMLSYRLEMFDDAILLVRGNEVRIYKTQSVNGGTIETIQFTYIGNSLSGNRVYNLRDQEGLLFKELSRRIKQGIDIPPLGGSVISIDNGTIKITRPDLTEGPIRSENSTLIKDSVESFLANVYHIPYSIPKVVDGYTQISFDQIMGLFSSGRIIKYGLNLNPLVQSFTGPPENGNRIMNFETSNGQKFFAIVRYDSGNIYPPV